MALKVNRVYRHKRHDTFYLLVALTNTNAEDFIKFQPMAVYVDEKNRTWSRPVAEFEENFELTSKINLETYVNFNRIFNRNSREFMEQYLD